jgi:hypothetical protein
MVVAAGPLGALRTVVVAVVYETATIAAMLALVLTAHLGASAARGRWIERWGDGAAGALVIAAGVASMVLGL